MLMDVSRVPLPVDNEQLPKTRRDGIVIEIKRLPALKG